MAVHGDGLTHAAEPVTPAGLVVRRRALGLTQRELGNILGVPRNTVARWERGDLRMARPDWLGLALASLEVRVRQPSSDTLEAGSSSLVETPHLPAELSSFVGRKDEVAECYALLTEHRLVTLTGVGGIGKSRLATKVARLAAADFPQGVYLVDLASVDDPAVVPRVVSTALGIAPRGGDATIDLLIAALRQQKLLLILDDCDRVERACGELAYRLLRCAPDLAILATCYEPLDVQGEAAWRVPPLKMPATEASFDEIANSDAVQLFVERSQAVAPWFKLTEANAPAVAYLCRRLDGIPLALELAAARMKALDLDQLIDRLEPVLEFLTGGSHTAPNRQQTLRAAIDWSYTLLSECERVLFRRLSVFAGGWTVGAAERVTEGDPLVPGHTLSLLERLIDKSFVVCDERYGVVRHSMLGALREYAYERLVEAGEEDRFRRRHFDWILDEVEGINLDELSPETIALQELQLGNVRCALAWSIDAGEAELGLRLATAACNIWKYRGHFAEGIDWIRRVLNLPGAAELPLLRGSALKWIGTLRYHLGDMSGAKASLTQGCDLLAAQTVDREPPSCSHLLGSITCDSGDLDGALRLFRQAEEEYREWGLHFWEQSTLFRIASVLFEQGDYAGSRAACDRCLALGRGDKFTWATSRARIVLAYLADREGDDAGAERLAQQALAQLRAIWDPTGMGVALRALSRFALEQRRLASAGSYLEEALDLACVEGDRMCLVRTLETTACVLASQAPDHAAQIAGASFALRFSTGTVPLPSEQARLTRWLGVARDSIDARAFDANWRIGEGLSDAETISAARQFITEALRAPAAHAASPSANSPLTARQQEVVVLVARGLTNEQIASELVISPATARAHVEHVLKRLALHSRAQLAAWAVAHGLVTTPEA